MSIQRMFNSLWAIVATSGMVQKIATNPYNPSPGSSDSTANNQALAAVTAGSPFITITQDGLAVGQPAGASVSTSLGSFNSSAGTPLDENSGQYQVVRQYGDIYMFNDGNIISWGGNGKNFSFGNGYEENHAWANGPFVYNKETFTIPGGAYSPYLLPNATVPSGASMPASLTDYEWLGGNVSKSWGNDYTFSYGTSYEWSAGPNNYVDAYGNTLAALTDVKQGKHCTYSYGTGYEETLVAWDQGSGWFHADDSSSPYAGRKHDDWNSSYLSMESVATSFASGAADQTTSALLGAFGVTGDANEEAIDSLSEGQAIQDLIYNPQDFKTRNTWKANNLLVSKTFGNTYDYHYGPGLSIQEGPSEERNYGNTSSTTVGNSTESVTGNSTSTVTGNSDETVTGNATAMIQGNATEQFWGGKAEFFMGGKSEMILGACDEITLSVKIELKTLGAIEVFGGIAIATFLGLQIEIQSGGKIEIGELTVKNKAAEVKVNDAAKVEVNGAASVQSSPVNVVTP